MLDIIRVAGDVGGLWRWWWLLVGQNSGGLAAHCCCCWGLCSRHHFLVLLLLWSSLSDIGIPEVLPLPVHDAMAASGECRRVGPSGGISLPDGLDIGPVVLCHLVPDGIVFIQFLLGWWRYWSDFLPGRLILFLFLLNPLCPRDGLLLVVGAAPLVVKDYYRAIDAEAVAVA